MIRIDLFFYSQDKFILLDKWIKKGLDSSSAIKKIYPVSFNFNPSNICIKFEEYFFHRQ